MAKTLSLKDWASSENAAKRAELKAALDLPIIQDALATLKDKYKPSLTVSLLPANLALTGVERLAWDGVARGGFYEFPTALASLAHSESVVHAPPVEAWGSLVKEGDAAPRTVRSRKTK